MFYSPMVVVSAHSPSGHQVKIVGPDAVQQAFGNVQNEFNSHDAKISALSAQLTELDAFTKYCAQHYPEVINEWVLTKMTKEKLGLTRKKEST